ncbi:MAG TPA: hypothetical protein VMJ64_16210 [Anaerolineales bacterium]|nr:hypothetical protein [Anaerolineales bacterium]
MDFSILALVGIALAAMFFGYFFGLFEGRGQGYKKRKKEEAAEPSPRAVAPAPEPLPPPSPLVEPPPPTAEPAGQSLLRLTLGSQQQPCLEIDGKRIDTASMDPQQRRRLIDLMVLMRPWIESGPVEKAEAPAPMPTSMPKPVAVASAHRPTVPPFEGQPSISSVPARVGTGPLTPPPEPVAAPTTMVGQIDAILQNNLVGTPLAGRGIHLVESAQGGAMVVVGMNRYAGIGDVPDPEVQAAIRAAITEWENKYTPG